MCSSYAGSLIVWVISFYDYDCRYDAVRLAGPRMFRRRSRSIARLAHLQGSLRCALRDDVAAAAGALTRAQANPNLIGMREARESAIVSSERFIVRPATVDDVKEMSGVLERAGLSSFRPEILEFNLASSSTQMFVGCRDGQVVGVAGCVRFGRTGWLGNVAVDDDFRGQGLGRAISQTAVDCLHHAGVETVLLTATALGRPTYERLGFADEGISYGIWEQQQAPILGCDHPATIQPGQIDEAIRQDAEATGEDRRGYLAPFADRARVSAGRAQAGYWVALPWGGGPVIAASRAAALPLIVDMIRTSPGSRLAFPELNVHGAALAVSLGFHLARRVRRMRLGPPVPGYRPGMIYNAFSLAAG